VSASAADQDLATGLPGPRRTRTFSGALAALSGVFGRAVNQIIALLVTLLAARWLSPASFGEYAIAAAMVTVTRSLLYAGAFEYLLKTPRGQEAATECLLINLGLAGLLGAVLVGVSFVTRSLFHAAEIGVLLRLMAPSNLLSAAANWQEAQLLRGGRLRTYYAVTTVAEVAAALVTVAMILGGFGLLALVAQVYARLFMLMLSYRALQRPHWSAQVSWARVREVGRWSSARYGATLVAFLSNYSADFLLGAFLSPAATGVYRASHRVVTSVSDLISNPTRMTAVTLFSRRAADGRDSAPLWPKVAAAAAFLGWTALAGLAAVSAPLTPLVLGSKWRSAGAVVAILCLQRAFVMVDGVTTQLLVAYGHARNLLAVQASMAVLSVILLLVMVRFGVEAAALSSSLTALVSLLVCAAIAARTFPNLLAGAPRVLPVALLPPLAASAAAFAALRLIRPADLGDLAAVAVAVAAGAAAFGAVAIALRRPVIEVLQALNHPTRAEA
jgi:O-antigen/teichoic acid export membrane protein